MAIKIIIKKCLICGDEFEGKANSKYCGRCKDDKKTMKGIYERSKELREQKQDKLNNVVECALDNNRIKLTRKTRRNMRKKRDKEVISQKKEDLEEMMKHGTDEENETRDRLEKVEKKIKERKKELKELEVQKNELLEQYKKAGVYKNCFGKSYTSGDYECRELCNKSEECRKICGVGAA